jgi:hypothetical protein
MRPRPISAVAGHTKTGRAAANRGGQRRQVAGAAESGGKRRPRASSQKQPAAPSAGGLLRAPILRLLRGQLPSSRSPAPQLPSSPAPQLREPGGQRRQLREPGGQLLRPALREPGGQLLRPALAASSAHKATRGAGELGAGCGCQIVASSLGGGQLLRAASGQFRAGNAAPVVAINRQLATAIQNAAQ